MNLLFPGRHLCNTAFQQAYLWNALTGMAKLNDGSKCPKITSITFAITSSNQENSRYNPIPFYERAIQVDRFAQQYREKLPCNVIGVPHFGQTPKFAEHTIKESKYQLGTDLSPDNTIVLCSTPQVIKMYETLGYKILPAELGQEAVLPVQIIKHLAEAKQVDGWLKENTAPATIETWQDYPDIVERIIRIYDEPLLTEEGSLTERDYGSYAYGMGNTEIIQLKYKDLRPHIKPGKIVDEGCADGALLTPIAKDFPDSDLIGIDISAEFIARCKERQRSGEFGGTYVHFHQRNLLTPIFQDNTINTTLCNSTLHELWSYAQQEKSVKTYLALKFKQLAPGGRLVARDVVGPEDKDKEIWLWCNNEDGKQEGELSELSTAARFKHFAQDFLHEMRDTGRRAPETKIKYREEEAHGRKYFVMKLKDAVEFITKKDYTDNWFGEMNEEFSFWDLTQWKQALSEAGFRILPQTHTYVNPWMVENRYKGKVELYAQEDGKLKKTEYPVTNMILVAQKPKDS